MHPDARVLLPCLLVLVAAGCEPMDPMDHPFQPVPVAATTADATAAPAPQVQDDRFAEFDEPFRLSSDQMGGDAEDAEPEAPEPVAQAATEPPAQTAPPPAPEPTVMDPVASAPMLAQVPAAPLGWAIRLVKTIPEAQPPRAILGLPDGKEVVVTPGSMLPTAGLVVLSIGPQGVQLARVQAMGDHANVDAISLTPQY